MNLNLKEIETLDLKDELENRGWFTEIMWQIEHVQMNFNCTDADAQGVLQRVFSSDHVTEVINDAIDEQASSCLVPH